MSASKLGGKTLLVESAPSGDLTSTHFSPIHKSTLPLQSNHSKSGDYTAVEFIVLTVIIHFVFDRIIEVCLFNQYPNIV